MDGERERESAHHMYQNRRVVKVCGGLSRSRMRPFFSSVPVSSCFLRVPGTRVALFFLSSAFSCFTAFSCWLVTR